MSRHTTAQERRGCEGSSQAGSTGRGTQGGELDDARADEALETDFRELVAFEAHRIDRPSPSVG